MAVENDPDIEGRGENYVPFFYYANIVGSKLGAILDTLADRCADMCLLCCLSTFYVDYMFLFMMIMFLDISSHWIHVHRYVSSIPNALRTNSSATWQMQVGVTKMLIPLAHTC
ncbi:CDP-diacylglycerol--inositol 3-phosphatidyltransferase [Clonorchis sinensis]|uniref:CDP-diacylglycerol--inositol 3-phosphatidyltransferase n=1 Tax=Clonorchis sinensis TaxID=79923 RepID=G7Y9M2_CLOSI|nr:CDP-diacylglycerol--inositol 3-phosphatidyltransferase [Clonorchis sinensis]